MQQSILRSFTFLLCSAVLLTACKHKEVKKEPAVNIADTLLFNKNPYVNADQSPMDMSWCPANYPVEKMKGNDSLKLVARLIYSRPHRKGRSIFGSSEKSLCVYGKPWRLGANEATEIDFFQNVSIGGKNVPKGTYVIYCIPEADHWTIILNSNLYTWGLNINEKDDIFRTEIPIAVQTPDLEDFTMVFQDAPQGADLVMAWDRTKAVLPVTFAK